MQPNLAVEFAGFSVGGMHDPDPKHNLGHPSCDDPEARNLVQLHWKRERLASNGLNDVRDLLHTPVNPTLFNTA
jgi:hypothetical protein